MVAHRSPPPEWLPPQWLPISHLRVHYAAAAVAAAAAAAADDVAVLARAASSQRDSAVARLPCCRGAIFYLKTQRFFMIQLRQALKLSAVNLG